MYYFLDNIYAYHTPNISIKNIINIINESVTYDNVLTDGITDFKRKFSLKNENNLSKDGPLAIINNNKKRKNEIENSNSIKKV